MGKGRTRKKHSRIAAKYKSVSPRKVAPCPSPATDISEEYQTSFFPEFSSCDIGDRLPLKSKRNPGKPVPEIWTSGRSKSSTSFLKNLEIKVIALLRVEPSMLKEFEAQFSAYTNDPWNELDFAGFLKLLKLKNATPIAEKMFQLIDLTGNSRVSLQELLVSCATFGLFSETEMMKFLFACVDKNGDGYIDEREYTQFKAAAPQRKGGEDYKSILYRCDVNNDSKIDYSEFRRVHHLYPALFASAFELQHLLQRVTLGTQHFKKLKGWRGEGQRLEKALKSHSVSIRRIPWLAKLKHCWLRRQPNPLTEKGRSFFLSLARHKPLSMYCSAVAALRPNAEPPLYFPRTKEGILRNRVNSSFFSGTRKGSLLKSIHSEPSPRTPSGLEAKVSFRL